MHQGKLGRGLRKLLEIDTNVVLVWYLQHVVFMAQEKRDPSNPDKIMAEGDFFSSFNQSQRHILDSRTIKDRFRYVGFL